MRIKLSVQNVEGKGHLGDIGIDRGILQRLLRCVVRIESSDGLL
jgi:hypothetical protein